MFETLSSVWFDDCARKDVWLDIKLKSKQVHFVVVDSFWLMEFRVVREPSLNHVDSKRVYNNESLISDQTLPGSFLKMTTFIKLYRQVNTLWKVPVYLCFEEG